MDIFDANDAMLLTDLCHRIKSDSVDFKIETETVVTFNAQHGIFYDFSKMKAMIKSLKPEEILSRYKNLMIGLGEISTIELIYVSPDKDCNDIYVIFSDSYRHHRSELLDVMYELMLNDNVIYNVTPISLDELDETKIPSDFKCLKRKHSNVQCR